MIRLGGGFGGSGFHELAKGVVPFDKKLSRSAAAALGVEKVAGIGTPGRMREQGCGRAPPRCGERERDILKRVRANFRGGKRFDRLQQKIFLRRGGF